VLHADVTCDPERLDGIFAKIDQCQLPGAAVGIAIGGQPVYRKGFGLAHLELPVALTPGMRMRIGSITKHFTCLAYLLLCEAGKAGLEDPLRRYLPQLSPVTHAVTLRQLMGHLSGLRDVHDLVWQFSGTGHPVTTSQLLSMYREIPDVNCTPGTQWRYNNGGFLLLGEVIEKIAERSLEDVLRERIFEPAGMHDTVLRRWDSDFMPNSATLHMIRPAGGFEKSYLNTALGGEGGVVSTVNDLLRWLAGMDAPVMGSPATWQTLRATQHLNNGTSTGYGFGLRSGWYRGARTLGHAGGVMGGNAQILKVPSAGLDVVVLVNRQDVSATSLAERILDVCIPSLDPPPVSSDRRFGVGAFRSPVTDRVVHLFGHEGKQIAAVDGVDTEVIADAEGVLRPTGPYSHLRREIVRRDDLERPSAIQLVDFGDVDELSPVTVARDFTRKRMTGRYRAETVDIDLTISDTGDELRLHSTGRFGSIDYFLTSLGEGVCRARSTSAMPWSGIITFADSYESFQFTTGRTVKLPFRRLS
jgi:D-aminopeptidase